MRTWTAAIVAVGMVTGCKIGPNTFACTDDASCGAGGKCEPGFNLCSFDDSTCPPPMRRYGDLGGPNAGQCVGQEQIDAGIDSLPDARTCFGTGIVQFCLEMAPTQPMVVSSLTTIDTGNSSMCAPVTIVIGGDYCVVAKTNITLNARLRASGPKPLVLLSTDSITSTAGALIDVGSHRIRSVGSPESGAGADPAACVLVAGTVPTSGGGGAGGSFAGAGGNGGNGRQALNTGGVAGAVASAITELRGGCAGQNGQGAGTDGGTAGHGGGAVFLIALNKIDIAGGILAGGEGGAGGVQSLSGGGGGGAGGMIGFDAPMITVTSMLAANGGAGGEGSQNTTAGEDGDDATTTAAAAGGSGNTLNGGDGGNGSSAMTTSSGANGNDGLDVTGGSDDGGGGGGGGGAGLIKAPASASLGPDVSPAATP